MLPIDKTFSKLLSFYYKDDKILEVASLIQQHVGSKKPLTNMPLLGKGSYASVFWLPDRKKVLKLTSDKDDANASAIVQKKPDSSLVKVYNVFQLPPGVFGETKAWGIVNEKLTPLPSSSNKIRAISNLFFDSNMVDDPTMKSVKEFYSALHNPQTKQQEYIPTYMQRFGVTEQDLQDIWVHWAKVLDKRHIIWQDFKESNVMMRGRTYVICDLGFSTVPQQNIPVLQA
jgi:hypothetical protein